MRWSWPNNPFPLLGPHFKCGSATSPGFAQTGQSNCAPNSFDLARLLAGSPGQLFDSPDHGALLDFSHASLLLPCTTSRGHQFASAPLRLRGDASTCPSRCRPSPVKTAEALLWPRASPETLRFPFTYTRYAQCRYRNVSCSVQDRGFIRP